MIRASTTCEEPPGPLRRCAWSCAARTRSALRQGSHSAWPPAGVVLNLRRRVVLQQRGFFPAGRQLHAACGSPRRAAADDVYDHCRRACPRPACQASSRLSCPPAAVRPCAAPRAVPKGPPPAASRLTATGNSGIPIFLRSIFAVLQRFRPNSPGVRFVLDNPRRITSSFFDSKQTAALFLIVSFNLLIQYIFFLATSLNKPEIIDSAPYNQLLNMGWFQSVSTRAAGMNVFDLRTLSKANAVIYALMMYIGSAPLVSLMQATEQTVVAKFVDGQVVMVYQARGRPGCALCFRSHGLSDGSALLLWPRHPSGGGGEEGSGEAVQSVLVFPHPMALRRLPCHCDCGGEGAAAPRPGPAACTALGALPNAALLACALGRCCPRCRR